MEDDTFELDETTTVPESNPEFETDEIEPEENIRIDLPDTIRKFILYFHKQVQQRNVDKLTTIYLSTFSKLSDRYFCLDPNKSLSSPVIYRLFVCILQIF